MKNCRFREEHIVRDYSCARGPWFLPRIASLVGITDNLLRFKIQHLVVLLLWFWALTANSAVFDLKSWNPADGKFAIDGEWDFYWKRLYTPSSFANNSIKVPPKQFGLPGVWQKSEGYATYRSHILLPDRVVQSRMPLTFELPNVPGAFKFWVGGTLAVEFGKVGKTPRQEIPWNGTSYYTFVPEESEIELVLQVSSFHHRDGGTWWPIYIASADDVTKLRSARVGLDGFTLSCLFIMAFYHFALWLYRPQYRAPLQFALFCCIIAIRASAAGIGDIHRLIYPTMPYGLQKTIEYASFYLAVPALYAFIRELYPEETRTWLHRTLWAISGVFTLATLLMPTAIFTNFIEYYQSITIVAIVLSGWQLLQSARKKRDGVGLLILGILCVAFASINDILHTHRHPLVPAMIFPYGVFLMALCQAILLAQRFSRAFHALEISEKKIQVLNVELQKKNEALDHMVDEKTRDIRAIMKNIKQGIFTLVGDGVRIGREFSDHLKSILNMPELKGGMGLDKILENTDLSSDRRSQIAAVLTSIVGEEKLVFELNAHLLPRELRLRLGHEVRTLELEWSAIESEHSEHIEKILVSLRDVSDFRKYQEEARNNLEELGLIGEVLNVAQDKFDGLMHSCTTLAAETLHHLKQNPIDLNLVFRNMHTLKGLARSYGLQQLADMAHDSEEVLSRLRAAESLSSQGIQEAITKVDSLLQRYNQINREKLGRKGASPDTVMIDRTIISNSLERLRNLDPKDREQHLTRILMDLAYTPLPRLLDDLLADIPRLAQDLGKENPDIVFLNPGLSIKPEAHDLFRNAFTHLLRNSMDHGLEKPAERQRKGKTPRGRIEVELVDNEKYLEVFVSDDGQGLDLDAIRNRAQERGLITSDTVATDYEVASLIFSPGLSTKNLATSVSGRGVGLDAVRSYIQQRQGAIDIQLGNRQDNQKEVPFRFHITLPAKVCEKMGVMGESLNAS